MYKYKVGEPYNPHIHHWPEGAQFNVRRGGPELLLAFRNVTAQERRAVKANPAQFALFVENTQILLLYHFEGGVPWSDAPFTANKLPQEEQPLLELEDGQHVLFPVLLLEATTGIIKAIRILSLSTDFMRPLYAAIQQQLAQPFDQAQYDSELARLYTRYPQSALMVEQAVARYRTKQRGGLT